jgi:hypothetical protein
MTWNLQYVSESRHSNTLTSSQQVLLCQPRQWLSFERVAGETVPVAVPLPLFPLCFVESDLTSDVACWIYCCSRLWRSRCGERCDDLALPSTTDDHIKF